MVEQGGANGRKAAIDGVFRMMPDRAFRREVLAEFLDDEGGVFINVREAAVGALAREDGGCQPVAAGHLFAKYLEAQLRKEAVVEAGPAAGGLGETPVRRPGAGEHLAHAVETLLGARLAPENLPARKKLPSAY